MSARSKKAAFSALAALSVAYFAPVIFADLPINWGGIIVIILLFPVVVMVMLLIGVFLTFAPPTLAVFGGFRAIDRAGIDGRRKTVARAAVLVALIAAISAYILLLSEKDASIVPFVWWLSVDPEITVPVSIAVTVAGIALGASQLFRSRRRRAGRHRSSTSSQQ